MILRGWKEICKYLDMSENTARELKESGGLPVKIIAGKPMTTVTMLDCWVEKNVKDTDRLDSK